MGQQPGGGCEAWPSLWCDSACVHCGSARVSAIVSSTTTTFGQSPFAGVLDVGAALLLVALSALLGWFSLLRAAPRQA
jgi:hypothetical protein